MSFAITGISLFGQVTDNYKHNPYQRDLPEVAELKSNIEITGNGKDIFIKNKTNYQLWMVVVCDFPNSKNSSSRGVIHLNPSENKKLPPYKKFKDNQGLKVDRIYPITKVENLKFKTHNRWGGKLKAQIYNGIEYEQFPAITITDKFSITDKTDDLDKFVAVSLYGANFKVYFDMLIIDDLGNKQVASKSEIISSFNLQENWLPTHEYIKQYNYSTFWVKITRIDLLESEKFY